MIHKHLQSEKQHQKPSLAQWGRRSAYLQGLNGPSMTTRLWWVSCLPAPLSLLKLCLSYSHNSKWRHMRSERPHSALTERVLWPKPPRRTQKLPLTDSTEHVLWPSLIHALLLSAINLNPAVSVNKAQPTASASPARQASVQGSGAFLRGCETANTGLSEQCHREASGKRLAL